MSRLVVEQTLGRCALDMFVKLQWAVVCLQCNALDVCVSHALLLSRACTLAVRVGAGVIRFTQLQWVRLQCKALDSKQVHAYYEPQPFAYEIALKIAPKKNPCMHRTRATCTAQGLHAPHKGYMHRTRATCTAQGLHAPYSAKDCCF
jgi:hypothetical protein